MKKRLEAALKLQETNYMNARALSTADFFHGPLAMLKLRPIRFVADVVGVYFGSHISRSAAELAYFMVLTLFPIFICLSAFVGQLHLDLAGLLEEAERFLP